MKVEDEADGLGWQPQPRSPSPSPDDGLVDVVDEHGRVIDRVPLDPDEEDPTVPPEKAKQMAEAWERWQRELDAAKRRALAD